MSIHPVLRMTAIGGALVAVGAAFVWWVRMVEGLSNLTTLDTPRFLLTVLVLGLFGLFQALSIGIFVVLALRLERVSSSFSWFLLALATLGIVAGSLLCWITPVLGAPVFLVVLVCSALGLYCERPREERPSHGGGGEATTAWGTSNR